MPFSVDNNSGDTQQFDALYDDLLEDDNPGAGVPEPSANHLDPSAEIIHDTDDYQDPLFDITNTTDPVGQNEPVEITEEEHQVIEDLLKSKGIKDSSKVLYENDEGEIEEVDFYSLDYEEQLNVLSSSDSDVDLEPHEIETVNFLRENNITLEQAAEYFKKQGIQEYLETQRGEGLQIDSLSDEEIFILDLKASYEDLTEDEIVDIMNHELKNEALFKRKSERLREEYREAEMKEVEEKENISRTKKQEKENKLIEDVSSIANTVDNIGGLDLSDDDKEEIVKHIFEKDINGISQIDKAIEDPESLFRIAWFLSKGEEAFEILHEYYKNEIDTVRKNTTPKRERRNSNNLKIDRKPVTRRSKFTQEFYTQEDILSDLYKDRKN